MPVSKTARSPSALMVAFHFFTGFVDHLFNPGWMDTAVDDQFFQSDPGNFAPDRVEAGQNDSFRVSSMIRSTPVMVSMDPDITAFTDQ
jgi:hypothetical protein